VNARTFLWIWVLFSLTACRAAPAANRDQQRISELEGENAQLREQVATLAERLESIFRKGDLPVFEGIHPLDSARRVDAEVLGVDVTLKLVILNKGKKDGVQPGYTFDVYRGSNSTRARSRSSTSWTRCAPRRSSTRRSSSRSVTRRRRACDHRRSLQATRRALPGDSATTQL